MKNIKSKLNLLAFCLSTFCNAIGFGFFYSNTSTFADFYNVSPIYIQNSFYVGLLTELIFCIPALKIIEWRVDYSIYAGVFLTLSAYWIQYLAYDSFYVILAGITMLGLGQSLLLPLSPYFAQKWFQLQNRSFIIALGFYSNILGLAFGGIFTAVYIGDDENRISSQILIFSSIATCVFVLVVVVIRNPKLKIQKYQPFSLYQVKLLWRQKFNSYSVLMSSVYLGLSWNFMSQTSLFLQIFSPVQVGILISTWTVSGCVFGMLVALVIDKFSSKMGSYRCNDITFKIITLVGALGYVLIGTIYYFGVSQLFVYMIAMIIIGIGNLGSFGLIYLSLIQTMYPISSLLIGTVIAVGASLYSTIIQGLSSFFYINIFFLMGMTSTLPWLYLTLIYQTNFKRYKYYLNQKKAQFQLLKIQEQSTTGKID